HAGSTAQTWDQLALMVKASAEGAGLEFSVIKRLLTMTIDVVVHITAHAGRRCITGIDFDPERTLAAHGGRNPDGTPHRPLHAHVGPAPGGRSCCPGLNSRPARTSRSRWKSCATWCALSPVSTPTPSAW